MRIAIFRVEIFGAGEVGFGGLERVVEEGFDLLPAHARIVFARGVNRVVALQVIDDAFEGNARALEDDVAPRIPRTSFEAKSSAFIATFRR
jgi:hypothetical protein